MAKREKLRFRSEAEMPTVERLNVRVEGAKRQYAPYSISWVCEKCGRAHIKCMHEDPHYLWFPIFGQPHEYTLYCEDCEHEETVRLQVDLTVTIARKVSAV